MKFHKSHRWDEDEPNSFEVDDEALVVLDQVVVGWVVMRRDLDILRRTRV